MEPLAGLQAQVDALQRTQRLLVGLLAPCLLLLLLLLACSLWLRWRPARRRAGGKAPSQAAPASPALPRVVPCSAVVRHGAGQGVVITQLPPPGRGPTGLPSCSGSRRQAARCKPPFCSPALLSGQRRDGAAQGTASHSSAASHKPPILVPPNSPVSTSAAAGAPEGAFASCLTSTQNRLRSWNRSASAPHLHSLPFEYGSSIRPHEDRRAQQNTANFTASQGPGLDSDFGASAGVSIRILSSDSEGSPNTPLLCGQQSGRFEWDYYDPSYKRKARLHRQLPHSCSKQYWL